MTQSQSIAKVFKFVGYILLIPATIGTLFSLLTFYFALIPIVIMGFGIWLLIGYRKHAKGELSEGKIIPLWIGTLVYNFLLIAPQVVIIFQTNSFSGIEYTLRSGGVPKLLYFSLITWQFLAILLSICALLSQISFNRSIGKVP